MKFPFEFYDQLPGIWCSVDKESKYQYLNSAYAQLVGIEPKKKDTYIGKTVAEIPCKASECADLFWKEDDLVRDTKEEIQVINILKLAGDEWKIIHIGKKPIIDPDSQEITSILFHINDLTRCPISSSLETMMFNKVGLLSDSPIVSQSFSAKAPNSNNNEFNIRQKESECLFFLVRGFSYKQIAKFRKVSPNTIIDQIERLKCKFNCNSKSELVAKANAMGYGSYVPQHLLDQQVSLILQSTE